MIKKFILILILVITIPIILFYALVFVPIPSLVSSILHPVPTPPQAKNVHYGFDYPGNEALSNQYHIRYDFSDIKPDQPLTPEEQYDNILQQIKFYEQDAKQKGGQLYGTDGFTPHGRKIPCQQAEDNYFKYGLSPINPSKDALGNYNYPRTRCFLSYGWPFAIYRIDFAPVQHTDIWLD